MFPIILAGGHGTQLWPLSRQEVPKPFLKMVSNGTLLQDTINFLNLIEGIGPIITVSSKRHRFMLAEQIEELGIKPHNMILEPVAKNTAAATILAALAVEAINPQEQILLIPSDHVILNQNQILEQINQLQQQIKSDQWGIIEDCSEDSDSSCAIHLVQCQELLKQAELHCPKLLEQCRLVYQQSLQETDFLWLDEESFDLCESIGIVDAIISKLDNSVRLTMPSGWHKIESWCSLWHVLDKNADNNALSGDVIAIDTKNSILHAEKKLLTTIGVDDLIVIETDDAVMVATKDKAEDVKEIVSQLKQQGRPEANLHLKVDRPWGNYDSVDMGDRHQVKRIMVKPGARLSLQSHFHRAEHWIVVKGTALVRIGEEQKEILLKENESTFIPVDMKHSLENPGVIPLEIIEVQTGGYLGEDDIVRYEDVYGRIKE